MSFNIGIFVDKNVTPDWGGGYYYQETLIAELAKRNGDAGFCFKIITNNTSYKNEYLEVIVLPEFDDKKVKSFLGRISRKSAKASVGRYNPIDEFLKLKSIHLLYYIQPHIGLTSTFPFVVTNWDMAHITASGFPDTLNTFDLRKWWVDEYFMKSLAIIADSEAGKSEILNYTNVAEDKVFVAPIFASRLIDLKLKDSEVDNVLGSLQLVNQSFLFYPAQFWALKNHFNLISSFRIAIDQGLSDIKLVLTGSEKGNYLYVVRLIKELNLENHIILTGFLSEIQVYALYKRAKALIFPSLLGPTNMPILEALNLECPIICSDLKGHREILGDYPGYFNPLDHKDMSDMILNISNDSYRTGLVKCLESRNKINDFILSKCVDNIIDTLKIVMNKRLCWS